MLKLNNYDFEFEELFEDAPMFIEVRLADINNHLASQKDKKDAAQINITNDLEREVEAMRERIETLEKIVTDEKYDLNRQFDDLNKDKVA